MTEVRQRIAWAISIIPADIDRGITDVELAKVLGTNKNTLADYRKLKGLIKIEVIDNLVRRYGFSPQWIFKGEGEPFPGARAKYPEVCGAEPLNDGTQKAEFVFIRQVNGKISAGEIER